MELVFWLIKKVILKRWAGQLGGVLNRPLSINGDAINRLLQVECNPLLDEFPTVSERVKGIQLLPSGKAPGSDAIPAEIYKAGGPPVAKRNWQSYFTTCGEKTPSPKNSRMHQLIPTYSNGKGILKSVAITGASLYCQLLGRSLQESYWTDWMNNLNSQGFYQNRGTIDMIFTARQVQEKCQEQNVDRYMIFVDLTRAFDTVSRWGRWKIMTKVCCPAKFTAIVLQLHNGICARV